MTKNLPMVLHAFPKFLLTSLSVDEILLLRYVNCSTNFRGLPLRVERVPFCLKHMKSFYLCLHRGQYLLRHSLKKVDGKSARADLLARNATHLHTSSVTVSARDRLLVFLTCELFLLLNRLTFMAHNQGGL